MKITNIQEAKRHLSWLVERAASGEEIVIGKAGKLTDSRLFAGVCEHRDRLAIAAGWRAVKRTLLIAC
jgi:antitoxin (DNA-binding transcriptional repressor) of toxin-antitoxin stability system